MTKYTIELSEDQMRLIADCLEDVSRFAAGQWAMQHMVEAMVEGLPFDEQLERRDKAEELLKQVKRVLAPEFPDNGGLGYNGTKFIGNTYQIYRSILHRLTVDRNVNNTYSSSALPSGDMGTVIIKKIVNQTKDTK
jgi:hypothetical protein